MYHLPMDHSQQASQELNDTPPVDATDMQWQWFYEGRFVSFQNGSTSPQKPTSGMAGGDLSRGTMMIWRRLSPEGSNRFMLSPTMLRLGTEETNMCQTCLLCHRKYQYLEGGDFDLWQHLCHQPGLHGTISKVNATEEEEVLHKFFMSLKSKIRLPFTGSRET